MKADVDRKDVSRLRVRVWGRALQKKKKKTATLMEVNVTEINVYEVLFVAYDANLAVLGRITEISTLKSP